MINSEILLNLPDLQLIGIVKFARGVKFLVRYTGPGICPHCDGVELRSKGRYQRLVRHPSLGLRTCWLEVEARKWLCLNCGRQFRQRLPGILPWQRASEAFREWIYRLHIEGINRSRLGRLEQIGAATVERYFQHGLQRQFHEWHPPRCPTMLGIDEHFFTRRDGYATTFCDLVNHKVYDVVQGRSEAALGQYLQALQGRDQVRMICIDLAPVYRALARKYFPNAIIVTDRFHVIRLINHHFLACWRELEPKDSANRGLRSLMRRHQHNLRPDQKLRLEAYLHAHPAVAAIYEFKQRLCALLTIKHRTWKQCRKLIPRFLGLVHQLRQAGLPQLMQLGETLHAWRTEIVAMWRFTRNNGITEGFHNKMELINRQAYGFRSFKNYRMRVKVLCA